MTIQAKKQETVSHYNIVIKDNSTNDQQVSESFQMPKFIRDLGKTPIQIAENEWVVALEESDKKYKLFSRGLKKHLKLITKDNRKVILNRFRNIEADKKNIVAQYTEHKANLNSTLLKTEELRNRGDTLDNTYQQAQADVEKYKAKAKAKGNELVLEVEKREQEIIDTENKVQTKYDNEKDKYGYGFIPFLRNEQQKKMHDDYAIGTRNIQQLNDSLTAYKSKMNSKILELENKATELRNKAKPEYNEGKKQLNKESAENTSLFNKSLKAMEVRSKKLEDNVEKLRKLIDDHLRGHEPLIAFFKGF